MAAVKHQYRRGTAAQWLAANPVLGVAEPGYDIDAKGFKLGDGVTAWTSLPFVPDMTTLVANYLNKTARGAANGVASLDASGLVPAGQLGPQLALYWQPNTAYKVGQVVISPGGMLVKSKTNHTSGTTFSGIGTNWASVAQGQSVVVRTNLVRDPRGVLGTDWSVTAGGGTPTKSQLGTGGPAEAASFVRATAGSAGWTYLDVRNVGSATNLVTPGKTYALSAGVRASYAGTVALYVQWLDAGGAVISTTSVASGANTANSWQRFGFVTAVAPANAVRGLLIVRVNGAPAVNDTLDVTAMLFCDVSEDGAYFDGTTAAGPETVYAWTGTAHQSTSTASSTSTQLALQSDLDKSAKGLVAYRKIVNDSGSIAASGSGICEYFASFTFKAGRRYKIAWYAGYVTGSAQSYWNLAICTCPTTDPVGQTTGLTQLGAETVHTDGVNLSDYFKVEAWPDPYAVDTTLQVKFFVGYAGVGSGNFVESASASRPGFITIEDMGAQI